ncbi:MAG: ceramidase domain-containing protein [Herpetosiphon sp.]
MRFTILLSTAFLGFLLLVKTPPLAQNSSYHHFADQRTLVHVPQFADVVSNTPFLLVGLLAFWILRKSPPAEQQFGSPEERLPYLVLAFGMFCTGLGSIYYHLSPSNERLVWDRLPITLAFMGLFSAMIAERISVRLGVTLLVPFVLAGIGSVVYWHLSELRGMGDLRPYLFIQFYPILAIPLLLVLFPPRYTRTTDLWVVLGLYLTAKIMESLDKVIYEQVGIVSGHTLKHVIAAFAGFLLVHMLRHRKLLVVSAPGPPKTV